MQYRSYGVEGVKLSVLGLGGHEFYEDGRIKGFSDNNKLAVTPGHLFPNFGDENRERIVSLALERGINFFDVTIDSEKEALGRILKKLSPSEPVYIQTRPEGMVYTYDSNNRKMADYEQLRTEVIRINKLLQREQLDILNLAFMKSALDTDPDYLYKITNHIHALKQEGLIRYANADTFSGNDTYLKQIRSGAFDSIYIHYNLAEQHIREQVLPEAVDCSMGVLTRELFMKGTLFRMADEAGIEDKNLIAGLAVK